MILKMPQARRFILLATALDAVAILFWAGLEDTNIAPAAALGAVTAALVFGHALLARSRSGAFTASEWFVWMILGGACAGIGAALCAILLMAIKVSLHSHDYPDFSPSAVIGLFTRAPGWGLAGLLIGLGLALIGFARR